jgi:hypothetical protein
MIGFSIEFKRWYFVLRGPRGRVYLATGFAKHLPIPERWRMPQAKDYDNVLEEHEFI